MTPAQQAIINNAAEKMLQEVAEEAARTLAYKIEKFAKLIGVEPESVETKNVHLTAEWQIHE